MKDIKLISLPDLKEAVKQLNESGLVAKKVKAVGVTKDDLIRSFAFAIESVPDDKVKEVPKISAAMYMDIFKDEIEAEGEGSAPPAEKAKPAKKEAVKKEVAKPVKKEEKAKPAKKEKAEKILKDVEEWGAIEGTQTYIINKMIREGGHTIEEMAIACNTKTSRVSTHINTLRNKRGHTIVQTNHKYYFKKGE